MQLHHRIASFYFDHAGQLSAEKRFHLASRLAAWNGNGRARSLLQLCRPTIVPEPLSDTTLADLFRQLVGVTPTEDAHIPAFAQREPYFQKYAPLFGVESALFRLRHLKAVYNIDARQAFLEVTPADMLRQLDKKLSGDPPAMRILSTYAINFRYLLHRILLMDKTGIDVGTLLHLGSQYALTDKEQLRLHIYFYTHCIIAESNFYVRPIPEALLPTYRQMLERLETVMKDRLADCSLDAKLEFLVCCRICGYDTSLFEAIYDECERSISPNGTFIVDTRNAFAGVESKRTFQASEHRNVLYIMSNSPYALD